MGHKQTAVSIATKQNHGNKELSLFIVCFWEGLDDWEFDFFTLAFLLFAITTIK